MIVIEHNSSVKAGFNQFSHFVSLKHFNKSFLFLKNIMCLSCLLFWSFIYIVFTWQTEPNTRKVNIILEVTSERQCDIMSQFSEIKFFFKFCILLCLHKLYSWSCFTMYWLCHCYYLVGSPYYDNVRPLCYSDSDAVLLCFDISRPDTVDAALKKVRSKMTVLEYYELILLACNTLFNYIHKS